MSGPSREVPLISSVSVRSNPLDRYAENSLTCRKKVIHLDPDAGYVAVLVLFDTECRDESVDYGLSGAGNALEQGRSFLQPPEILFIDNKPVAGVFHLAQINNIVIPVNHQVDLSSLPAGSVIIDKWLA